MHAVLRCPVSLLALVLCVATSLFLTHHFDEKNSPQFGGGTTTHTPSTAHNLLTDTLCPLAVVLFVGFVCFPLALFALHSTCSSLCTLIVEHVTLSALVQFVAICFGAPLFQTAHQTLLLSTFIGFLLILSLQKTTPLKVPSVHWLAHLLNPISNRLAIIGAWMGAFVIPLDWDRDWQVWPVPCLGSTWIGFSIGVFIELLGFEEKIKK